MLSEECAASVDALLETDENIAFVEFKNGKVNNRNIKDKIRDSLLLFCDLTKQTISDTRKNLDFIVVYNEEKNPLPNQFKKQAVSDAPSRIAIGKYFLGKGNEELSDLTWNVTSIYIFVKCIPTQKLNLIST